MKIETALAALKQGKIVLVYHSSEKETAMIVAAEKINLDAMKTMKEYASSDIACVVDFEDAKQLGLYFLVDVLRAAEKKFYAFRKIRKKTSSCSIPLDHIRCRTGSSDKDKLLLINELVKIVRKKEHKKFCNIVSMPGHLKFFIAKDLTTRQGHTELAITLTKLAGMLPIAIICSMRDPKTGTMLTKRGAMRYAAKHGFIFLKDKEIIKYKKV